MVRLEIEHDSVQRLLMKAAQRTLAGRRRLESGLETSEAKHG